MPLQSADSEARNACRLLDLCAVPLRGKTEGCLELAAFRVHAFGVQQTRPLSGLLTVVYHKQVHGRSCCCIVA